MRPKLPQHEAQIREWAAAGKYDAWIGKVLGVTERAVAAFRYRRGIVAGRWERLGRPRSRAVPAPKNNSADGPALADRELTLRRAANRTAEERFTAAMGGRVFGSLVVPRDCRRGPGRPDGAAGTGSSSMDWA